MQSLILPIECLSCEKVVTSGHPATSHIDYTQGHEQERKKKTGKKKWLLELLFKLYSTVNLLDHNIAFFQLLIYEQTFQHQVALSSTTDHISCLTCWINHELSHQSPPLHCPHLLPGGALQQAGADVCDRGWWL